MIVDLLRFWPYGILGCLALGIYYEEKGFFFPIIIWIVFGIIQWQKNGIKEVLASLFSTVYSIFLITILTGVLYLLSYFFE